MIGTCDQCQRDDVEVESVELLWGDRVDGHVLLCERCEESDEPISVIAQMRAGEREAEYWSGVAW